MVVQSYILKRKNKYSKESLDNAVKVIQEDSLSISKASKKNMEFLKKD